MTTMTKLRFVGVPNVGTVIENIKGGFNWSHVDGTDTFYGMPANHEWLEMGGKWLSLHSADSVDYFTPEYARASLLAYHFTAGQQP